MSIKYILNIQPFIGNTKKSPVTLLQLMRHSPFMSDTTHMHISFQIVLLILCCFRNCVIAADDFLEYWHNINYKEVVNESPVL